MNPGGAPQTHGRGDKETDAIWTGLKQDGTIVFLVFYRTNY